MKTKIYTRKISKVKTDHQQRGNFKTNLWHFRRPELLRDLLHEVVLEAGAPGGGPHAGDGQPQDLPRPRPPSPASGAAGDAHTLRIQSQA